MAVKTTKQLFNQDCTFLGKAEFDQDVVLGKNGEVDGNLQVNGSILNEEGEEKYLTTDTNQNITGTKKIQINGNDYFILYGNEIKSDYHFDLCTSGVLANYKGYGLTIHKGNEYYTLRYPSIVKNGTFALTSDIPALYRHTVAIKFVHSNALCGVVCFTVINQTQEAFKEDITELCKALDGNDFQVSGQLLSPNDTHDNIGEVLFIRFGGTVIQTMIALYEASNNQYEEQSISAYGTIIVTDTVSTIVAPIATKAKEDLFPEEEDEEPSKMK